MSLSGKTLFITGASRGIGREIALRAAKDGANIVIAAKSAEAHPKLPGTIYSVAAEVEAAGGKALALQLDVRDEEAVRSALAQATGFTPSISLDEGLLHLRLTCVFVDSRGLVWYGAESAGLACYNPQTRTTKVLNRESGLSADAVRTIVEDARGRIWVGTAGAGINCIEYGAKLKVRRKISIESGMHSSNVYLMVFDSNHNLIVGSESGLDILDLNETNQIKSIKHYGKSDGFLGVETCQNSVWKDPDGKIWFGTINGVSCYNLSNLQVNKTAPILSILDVQLFYESLITKGL